MVFLGITISNPFKLEGVDDIIGHTLSGHHTMITLQKSVLPSPYERVAAAWREMRARVQQSQAEAAQRPLGCGTDYVVEADTEENIGVYRIFTPTQSRREMALRMQDLAELMRRKNYLGALIDVRNCRFDSQSAESQLAQTAVLPYAINPLWRLALLVPADDQAAPAEMFDMLLKLHRRAGVQMQKFTDYAQAISWLQRAREGRVDRL